MNLISIAPIAALTLITIVSGCEEAATSVATTNNVEFAAITPSAESVGPAGCESTVIAMYGVSAGDIFAANDRVSTSGVTWDVVRHSTSSKWVCNLNKAGAVIAISNEVPL